MQEINRRLDVEILVSLCLQAGLIEANESFIGTSYNDSDDLILDLSRMILRDRYADTDTAIRIHRNQEGFSVSIKNDLIENTLDFINMNFDVDFRDEEFNHELFYEFVRRLRQPDLNYFHLGDTYQPRDNRLVFYIRYRGNRYHPRVDSSFLVSRAIFELIFLVEEFEVAYEDIDYHLGNYNAHRDRREEILERERLEREEREQREREERERAIAEQREDYERRQRLLRQGATEEGIDIAERMLNFLRNQE